MKANSHPETILEQFDRLADDWTMWSILTGTVVAGSITVAGLMLAVVLDMTFQFEAGARAIVLGVWVVASVAALLVFLVRAMRQRRTHDGMARRLEQIFPQLSSDLINLVQLSRDHTTASATLKSHALHQAAVHAAKVPLETAASQLSIRDRFRLCMQTPRDLAGAIAVCLMLALCGGILHRSFPAWPNSVYRLFRPGQFVPAIGKVRITEVTPGNCELLSGSPFNILASVENPGHRNVEGQFVKLNADGTEQRLPLVPSENCDRYSLTLPKVTDPFKYRLEIGHTQTEHFAVTIYDRPAIQALTATYHYPSYTGIAEKTVELSDGVIEAPQFTRVDLAITTVAPVTRAIVAIGNEEFRTEHRFPRNQLSIPFMVIESGFYTVSLTDDHNCTNSDPPRHRLVIAVDQPPRAEIASPGPETTAAAGGTVALELAAADDYGVTLAQLLVRQESAPPDQEQVVQSWTEFRDPRNARLHHNWLIPSNYAEGTVLVYRLSVRDNRRIDVGDKRIEPQTTFSPFQRVRIVDRERQQAQNVQSLEKLRQQLWKILKRQTEARMATVSLTIASELSAELKKQEELVNSEQHGLLKEARELAAGISGDATVAARFKSVLTNLAAGRMQEAVSLADDLEHSDDIDDCHTSSAALVHVQDDILDVLRKLLDVARDETSRALAELDQRPGGDLPADTVNRLQELHDKLKEFLKQQRKVIEASEDLAKQPVEDFTKEDEESLKEIKASQDDWSKFMIEKHSDLSKLPEQDFSNPSLLEELIEVANELKMASDALTQKSVEIAVPLEQLGAEMAEEMTTNIEKWLPDTPDRERWKQEEPLTDAMREAPMAELPHQLEDIVGELMEQEEDLFDEMEDVTSSWADSIDKGAGWDAMDGPISNNSARGVTGNRLPNTSEIGGRSGEGRQGKSSGEFVGDSAVGKGGRNTPSRLTPDPFEAGKVNDTSTDPVGGATGGGKESGQGGEGLEGPAPPAMKRDLSRLADKQATLRNRAETIRLQFKIVNYNTASLDELVDRMRQVERQLRSGFFRSALRRRDLTLGGLTDLRTQTSEAAAVTSDATANVPQELRRQIIDSMAEKSPEGWEELNKSYFKRLATGK